MKSVYTQINLTKNACLGNTLNTQYKPPLTINPRNSPHQKNDSMVETLKTTSTILTNNLLWPTFPSTLAHFSARLSTFMKQSINLWRPRRICVYLRLSRWLCMQLFLLKAFVPKICFTFCLYTQLDRRLGWVRPTKCVTVNDIFAFRHVQRSTFVLSLSSKRLPLVPATARSANLYWSY